MIYFTSTGRKARRKLNPGQTVKVIRLVNEARMFWSGIAQKNNWFDPTKPFYVQVWVDSKSLSLIDLVYAKKEANSDIVVFDREEIYAHM